MVNPSRSAGITQWGGKTQRNLLESGRVEVEEHHPLGDIFTMCFSFQPSPKHGNKGSLLAINWLANFIPFIHLHSIDTKGINFILPTSKEWTPVSHGSSQAHLLREAPVRDREGKMDEIWHHGSSYIQLNTETRWTVSPTENCQPLLGGLILFWFFFGGVSNHFPVHSCEDGETLLHWRLFLGWGWIDSSNTST